MKGTLNDGRAVNLWEVDRPLTFDKPDSVAANFHGRRYRKYLMNLWSRDFEGFRRYFAVYLASSWEAEHPGLELREVTIYFQLEVTPPPGQPRSPVETKTVWVQQIVR